MIDLEQEIHRFREEFYNQLNLAKNETDLEQVRIKFLSRQGPITELMNKLKELDLDAKRNFGPKITILKEETSKAFDEKEKLFKEEALKTEQSKNRFFDVTAYKASQIYGSLHPYTITIEHIQDILITMGYEIIDGTGSRYRLL